MSDEHSTTRPVPEFPVGAARLARSPRAEDVIAHVERFWGAPCAACRLAVLGQELVVGLFLGAGDAPRCGDCLARLAGRPRDEFLHDALRRIARLDCYAAGWAHSDRRLRTMEHASPERWPDDLTMANARMHDDDDSTDDAADPRELAGRVAERFDAGTMACGELVLVLRRELAKLRPGEILHLSATDSSAPHDLPAWCGLTGHALRAARHPHYWIERRSD